MIEYTEYLIGARFTDPKNITVGQARVIYGPHSFTRQKGWHLPGGGFTADRDRAHACAVAMDQVMGGAA